MAADLARMTDAELLAGLERLFRVKQREQEAAERKECFAAVKMYRKARREYAFVLRTYFELTYKAIGERFGIGPQRARDLVYSQQRREAWKWYKYNGKRDYDDDYDEE